jgi:type I restriction enzyme S subunit
VENGNGEADLDFADSKKPKVQFELDHFEKYDIPESWEWKSFWQIAQIKSNLVEPNNYPNLIFVAPDNIQRESSKLINVKTVGEIAPISSKHLFFEGQIVYSKIRPYLSKLFVAKESGLCSADMYPIKVSINTDYLKHFMLSEYFVEKASNIGTRTILPKINQEELNSIPIAVPPLPEQKEIVRRVEDLFKFADSIEERFKQAKAQVDKLTNSILAKAFRGELVPQDDADEPASVLLEKIKAEKMQKPARSKSAN